MHKAAVPFLVFLFLPLLAAAVAPAHAASPVSAEFRAIPPMLIPAQGYRYDGRGRGQGDQRTRERYEQWQNLSPAEKEMYRRRMDQYRQLPPQERQRYEHRYDQYRNLPPDEQERIHRNLDRWPSLPQDEKQRMRNRFAP